MASLSGTDVASRDGVCVEVLVDADGVCVEVLVDADRVCVDVLVEADADVEYDFAVGATI